MPSFEESLKKLETIVDQLEKGDLALEDSLKLFEEGVGLSAACKQELDAAEGGSLNNMVIIVMNQATKTGSRYRPAI